jgi:hypothetical protein
MRPSRSSSTWSFEGRAHAVRRRRFPARYLAPAVFPHHRLLASVAIAPTATRTTGDNLIESGLRQTHWCREQDSKFRFLVARRQTVMGDGTAVSKTGADLLGNRRFESISSSRQSVSLPQPLFEGREPRFSARVWAAGLATGSAETRQAFRCAPTGGNISVGPYSSTAVPMRWSTKMPRRSRQSWVFSAVNVRGSLNSDRA